MLLVAALASGILVPAGGVGGWMGSCRQLPCALALLLSSVGLALPRRAPITTSSSIFLTRQAAAAAAASVK